MSTTSEMIAYTTRMDTRDTRSANATKFLEELSSHNCFELIPDDRPVKLYYDVDIKKSVDDGPTLLEEAPRLLDGLLQCFETYFGEKYDASQIGITTSHSASFIPYTKTEPISKVSFGFIFNNIISLKCHQKRIVNHLNKFALECIDSEDLQVFYTNGDNTEVFDSAPYSNGMQKIRCLHSSKPDERRPKKLLRGTTQQCIITAFIPNDAHLIAMEEPSRTTPEFTPEMNSDTNQFIFKYAIEKGLLTRYAQSGQYKNWIKVGWIIKNTFNDCNLWHVFSALGNKEYDKEKCNDVWDNMERKGGVKMGTLIHLMRQTDEKNNTSFVKEMFQQLKPKKSISLSQVLDPYASSLIISKTLKNTLVLCKEKWFMLTESQLWKQQNEPSYYIIREFHTYLDAVKEGIDKQIAQSEGEAKEKLLNVLKEWLKTYTLISKPGYLSVLTKNLRAQLADDSFENKLDNNPGKLAFKNGIVDLETKHFEKGIHWNDFITQTIPYDYIPADTSYIKSVLKPTLNNNDDHLDYYLSVVGYSLIGLPQLEKSAYFIIDKTNGGKGDNGKSFCFELFRKLLPNYIQRSKSSLLDSKNTKIHKQLATMKGARLVFLEEMPREKLINTDLLKELADGHAIENEVMFGTTELINIMFKLFALSNHTPKIDPKEQAIYNRYKQISFGSHFDRTGERKVADPENLKFIADPKLEATLLRDHRNEIFSLLVEYANLYYTRKGLPAIPEQFQKDTRETKQRNDVFATWFDENCIIEEGARIPLDLIIRETDMGKKEVKEAMALKGFKYDSQLKKMGNDTFGNQYRGGFEGVKYLTQTTDEYSEYIEIEED